MRHLAARLALVVATLVVVGAAPASGDRGPSTGLAGPPKAGMPSEYTPPEMQGIDIRDERGAKIPLDLPFVDQDGQRVTMGDYLDGDKPVVLVLAYYTCPQMCGLVLNGVLDAAKALDYGIGKDFRVVVVSFDQRDTMAVAKEKRANFLSAYGKDVGPRGWDFLVGTEDDVRKLADTVGFVYKYDPVGNQYAHASGIFVLTPTGTLSQTLYGFKFNPRDLRFSLIEAGEGKLGSAMDRVILRCFHWDPDARGYKLAAIKLMKWGGAVFLVLLVLVLVKLWGSDRRRHSSSPMKEISNVRT